MHVVLGPPPLLSLPKDHIINDRCHFDTPINKCAYMIIFSLTFYMQTVT